MVFDPVTFEVTGILDWEWAHAGDPVEDLAWCEWIIRRHHPAEIGHLDRLFAGYGHRPPWPMRQAAAHAKCRQMLELVRTGPNAEQGYRRWQENVAITQAWAE
jgi:aminoglycoside phosphotransferase (APT) family kinase protein